MYTHSVYLTLGWLSTVSDNNNVTVSSSRAVFFFIYAQVNMCYTRVTNPAKWRHGAHTVAKPNLLEKWRGKYETVSFPCATTTYASTSESISTIRFIRTFLRSFSVSCLSWILSGEPSAIALEHVLVWKVGFSI